MNSCISVDVKMQGTHSSTVSSTQYKLITASVTIFMYGMYMNLKDLADDEIFISSLITNGSINHIIILTLVSIFRIFTLCKCNLKNNKQVILRINIYDIYFNYIAISTSMRSSLVVLSLFNYLYLTEGYISKNIFYSINLYKSATTCQWLLTIIK